MCRYRTEDYLKFAEKRFYEAEHRYQDGRTVIAGGNVAFFSNYSLFVGNFNKFVWENPLLDFRRDLNDQ